MGKALAKSRRSDAERAAEWYLYKICNCLPHTIRRAIRAKFQAVDFWHCDVMGRASNGLCFYAQATTGKVEAVRQRRRKLEKIPWNMYDNVMVLQMVELPDPANQRKKKFYFRIHALNKATLTWNVGDNAEPIPREWFKKLRVLPEDG